MWIKNLETTLVFLMDVFTGYHSIVYFAPGLPQILMFFPDALAFKDHYKERSTWFCSLKCFVMKSKAMVVW